MDQALTTVTGSGESLRIASARLAHAESWWLTGKPDSAMREAELADDLSAGCDAWTRGAIGVWLRRTGSARSPRGELAQPYQLEMEGEWQRAGPRSATRAHPLGLTRREREVLDLICDGHTNAQIAARLFISAKTVDHHVSAVLAKLDAPSRDAAASHTVRLGLAGAAEI